MWFFLYVLRQYQVKDWQVYQFVAEMHYTADTLDSVNAIPTTIKTTNNSMFLFLDHEFHPYTVSCYNKDHEIHQGNGCINWNVKSHPGSGNEIQPYLLIQLSGKSRHISETRFSSIKMK